MARRQRIDSAAAAVSTLAAAAAVDVSPPKHVRIRRGDIPFWNAVIAARAQSEWTDSDLVIAANLARAMADAEQIATITVNKGGYVDVELLAGTIAASDKLARRIVTLQRALGIDSRSRNGEQRDVNKRRAKARAIEDAGNPLAEDEDDLLARPTLN